MIVRVFRLRWDSKIHNTEMCKYYYSKPDYDYDRDVQSLTEGLKENKGFFAPENIIFEGGDLVDVEGPWEIRDKLRLDQEARLLGPNPW